MSQDELDQAYGKSIRGLSKKLSHDMPLLKMLPICAISGLTKLSKIYGRSGMTANGILYQLAPLVLVTSGKESGLLPTPRAAEIEECPIKFAERARKPSAKNRGKSLNVALQTLSTPTCRDSGSPLPPRKKNPTGGQKPPLVSVIGTKLNPSFVEWMMGFPEGWSDIEENESSSSAML